ncbi:hypothetical protein [Bradyrhizobium sp. USDA 4508]
MFPNPVSRPSWGLVIDSDRKRWGLGASIEKGNARLTLIANHKRISTFYMNDGQSRKVSNMAKSAPRNIDYRNRAHRALERARAELASNDDERLPYAVLELRFAMEAITYDRAQAFRDELPYEEYRTWQPKRVVAVLAGIDPSIVKSSTIRFGLEDQSGAPSTNANTLGTECVLSAEDIKGHYDKLGSRLHIPTISQFQDGRLPDPIAVRAQCDEVLSIVDLVLSSKVWNSTLGLFSQINCMRCDKPLRRRMPVGGTSLHVQCFDCKADYTVEQDDGEIRWSPKMDEAPCANVNCTREIALWPDQLKPGTYWTCKDCGTVSEISLRVGVRGEG